MPAEKNWFETWFNSHYYDVLYQHRNEDEAARFIDSLLNHLQPAGGALMLDAACGKGRHAIYLAEKNFDVTGIDLSFKNIRRAREDENDHLSFFQHDMRKVFRVNYFDFVFNFYTSFGYSEQEADDLNAIRSFATGLKPGGLLVIDFFNVNYILAHLIEDESKVIDNIAFKISKTFSNGFIIKEIEILDKGEKVIMHERVKAISKMQFENYFQQCGLRLLNVFGDYALNPFRENISERLILIVQK